MKPRRALLTVACVALTATVIPRWLCGRDAAGLFDGEITAQTALADAVADDVLHDITTASFSTGSDHFNGEWTLVTQQMAILGLAQVVREHPTLRPRYLRAIRSAADQMVREDSRRFGTTAWGEDGLRAFDSPHGHAYLGYMNLALGALREVDPEIPHAGLHERLTASLARRIALSPSGMIETFPNETYPPDVTSVIGSIGQHDRVTRSSHAALLAAWEQRFRTSYCDPQTGYVLQRTDAATARAEDHPRGSGTAISAYFLSFATPQLARDLSRALSAHGQASFLGFGGVREFPPGVDGQADIDSGPLFFGVGVSATGFGLASARMIRDRGMFTALYRTTHLFGAPIRSDGTRWVSGGPIGNAVLLAMLTARTP